MIARTLNSASNLHRRKECPGSANAESGLPDSTSPDAAEGTLLHHHDANTEEDRSKLTHKQREILLRNADLRERFLQHKRDELELKESPVVFKEREFFLCGEDLMPIDPDFTAHPDLVLWFREARTAFIFDSKFGRNPVESADANMQLRTYAVVLNDECPCDRIFVAITQPWLPAPQDFHAAEYSGADLPHFKREILRILEEARNPIAPRVASVSACAWCKAQSSCKEAAKIIFEVAVARVNGTPIPQLEKMWPEVKRAEKVIAAIKERLEVIARDYPDALTTLKLGGGGTNRSLVNPVGAADLLADAAGIDRVAAANLLLSVADISIPKLTASLAELKGLQEPDAERWLEEVFDPVLVRTARKPQLVKK